MSLTAASGAEWLPPAIRSEAARILREWQAPPLDSEPIQDWIRQVLGYFRGCYRNPAKSGAEQWHASHVLILKQDPIEHAADHCGVRLVRQYYPAFIPTVAHFAEAYWGEKIRAEA